MFFNIIVIVDRKILIQNLDRILCIFVVSRSLLTSNHDIANSITDVNCDIFVPFLHFMSQFDMGLLDLVGIFTTLPTFICLLAIIVFLLAIFGERLGDNQLGNINFVLD